MRIKIDIPKEVFEDVLAENGYFYPIDATLDEGIYAEIMYDLFDAVWAHFGQSPYRVCNDFPPQAVFEFSNLSEALLFRLRH